MLLPRSFLLGQVGNNSNIKETEGQFMNVLGVKNKSFLSRCNYWWQNLMPPKIIFKSLK